MRTVYLDENFCCHLENNEDGSWMEFATDKLDHLAPEVIESYRLIPEGYSWTNLDGVTFQGEMVAPWVINSKLDAIQRAYEGNKLADAENALRIMFGGASV